MPARSRSAQDGIPLPGGPRDREEKDARRQTDRDAGQSQRSHGCPHQHAALDGTLGAGRARLPKEDHSAHLDEAGEREGPRHAEQHQGGNRGQGNASRRVHGVKEPQEHEPFADESVEWRKTANGGCPEREEPGCPRHRAPEPAKAAHLPGARGVQHRTGAEEKKGLEQPVIPYVQEPAGQGEEPPRGIAVLRGDERKAEADEDDADVLHAVVGEEPLEVVLAERERDSQHRAHDPERPPQPIRPRAAPASTR